MREECQGEGKYCGIKRHTKAFKIEHSDLSFVKYPGSYKCSTCDTLFDYEVVNQQIIYKIRNKTNEHISEIESSEEQVSSAETEEVGVK